MRFVRYVVEKGSSEEILFGVLNNDNIECITASPFEKWEKTGEVFKDYEVKLLTPCNPTKIVCIGLNYRDHAKELEKDVPKEPIIFIKPSSSLLSPEEYIVKPSICKRLDYEAELAVVIGRVAKNIKPEDAKNYILGYTCFNDITARDIQKKDGQWTRAKSFDTFAPLGPVIRTNIDPDKIKIELVLNDRVMQSSNTSNMIFNTQELVSYVSKVMTLYPGDVIAAGTPPEVGGMGAGDVVEVVIEEIGSLRNYVTDEEI